MLETDNILVLIQLIGGNDSLNTIVPINCYAELYNHRENIIIPEKELLKTNLDIGFHPATNELFKLFMSGQMSVINNIGYPLPNRSHFRSMDIWNSGSPSNEQWSTGWIGRFLDMNHSNYPTGYPNNIYPDPLAITVGNIVSDTCQGKFNNYSHVVDNLNSFIEINKCNIGTMDNNNYSDLLKFLNSSIGLANLYSKQIEKAASKGNSLVSYPDGNKLAQELKIVAKLISGGLSSKIYILSMGGFDTHAYQVTENKTSNGMHSLLLKQFSNAIGCFINDLKLLNCYKNVSILSYSEFGRQIKSNSSFGSDHGDATSIYLFGDNCKNQLIGKTPEINKNIEKQQGLEMEIDFRDFYASLLNEWFSVPLEKTNQIFKKNILSYKIFNN